jgi:hypothetical protein
MPELRAPLLLTALLLLLLVVALKSAAPLMSQYCGCVFLQVKFMCMFYWVSSQMSGTGVQSRQHGRTHMLRQLL